ncbi:MAG: GGDEF domain-containing protein [Arcobacteraceae bacterium]|nr:GGDEF domain-containing protein [Arcobacteraceae bacterium]
MNLKYKNDYKNYIFIAITPIITVSLMFTYALFYVKDEINFIKHELLGLNNIYKVQDITFDIQVLRGLSNMKGNNSYILQDIDDLNLNIRTKTNKFKMEIVDIPDGIDLRKKFDTFLNQVVDHTEENSDFEHISQTILESRLLLENISYHSNLILDSKLESAILIKTIIKTLPELIEYNGQIRGISSSIDNNKLTSVQKNEILILQSKIKDNIENLRFIMKEINSDENKIIKTIYKNTIMAQDALFNFVTEELLLKDKIMLDSKNIFRLETNNIEFIKLLYKENYKKLIEILNKRIKDKTILYYIIFFSGLLSIIFILLINLSFYRKNQKYIKTIKLLSITDGMTKLYNRRYFDIEFDNQRKIQKRLNRNLIFIMMDIDHFKQYNDTYGHHMGDDALIAVANCLKNDLNRPDDFAFRLGGEEFGVLCSDMDESKAKIFANKLRININNLKIKHSGNSANKFVTISMGLIVITPTCECEMDNIYKYADEALYKAKNNGRNQVSLFDTKSI